MNEEHTEDSYRDLECELVTSFDGFIQLPHAHADPIRPIKWPAPFS